MKILKVSEYRAMIYMNDGRQVELSCSRGEVGLLIEEILLPISTEFRRLGDYNRALLLSMEDTCEVELKDVG